MVGMSNRYVVVLREWSVDEGEKAATGTWVYDDARILFVFCYFIPQQAKVYMNYYT